MVEGVVLAGLHDRGAGVADVEDEVPDFDDQGVERAELLSPAGVIETMLRRRCWD